MKARPNINGNTREDFKHAYDMLNILDVCIANVHKKLILDVLHGRNYQHLPPDEARAALEEDCRILADFRRTRQRIDDFQNAMVQVVKK